MHIHIIYIYMYLEPSGRDGATFEMPVRMPNPLSWVIADLQPLDSRLPSDAGFLAIQGVGFRAWHPS